MFVYDNMDTINTYLRYVIKVNNSYIQNVNIINIYTIMYLFVITYLLL